MNRRDFLKSLQAGVYAVALPAIPMVSEARYWEFTIHSVEVLDVEDGFGTAVRGMATLVDRPDIDTIWAVKIDPEMCSVDDAMPEINRTLKNHFRERLEMQAA